MLWHPDEIYNDIMCKSVWGGDQSTIIQCFLTATSNSLLQPQVDLCILTMLMTSSLGLPWAATETVLRPQGAVTLCDQVAEPLRLFCACSKEAPWSCDLSHLWWSCWESTATLLRPLVALGDPTGLWETSQGSAVRFPDLQVAVEAQ